MHSLAKRCSRLTVGSAENVRLPVRPSAKRQIL